MSEPHQPQINRVAIKNGKYQIPVALAGHHFQAIAVSPTGAMDEGTTQFIRRLAKTQEERDHEYLTTDCSRSLNWNTPRHMLALVQIGVLRGVAQALPKRHESLLRQLQRHQPLTEQQQ